VVITPLIRIETMKKTHEHITFDDVRIFVKHITGEVPAPSHAWFDNFTFDIRFCGECRKRAGEACRLMLPDEYVQRDPMEPAFDCPDLGSLDMKSEHAKTCAYCQRSYHECVAIAEVNGVPQEVEV